MTCAPKSLSRRNMILRDHLKTFSGGGGGGFWGPRFCHTICQILIITPSGPITVVILVVNMDYISELTIHSAYVHPFV